MEEVVLAVDVGGTKIALGLVTRAGALVARDELPTWPEEGAARAISRIDAAARGLLERTGRTGFVAVGLGVPGPIDFGRGVLVAPPNLRAWWEFPLVESLSRALRAPVTMENDANAAALGEHRYGAGRAVADLVYLTVSTGVGAGAIVGGRLLTGAKGNAAELGHCTVQFQGRRCSCGLLGCLEAYASGTAIARRAMELISSGHTSVLGDPEWLCRHPRDNADGVLTAAHVVAAVSAGDHLAREIWEEAMNALAAGVANALHAFNPSLVIIGGGLTGAGELLFGRLRELVPTRTLRAMSQVAEIVPASLGADVGVLGAAAIAWDAHEAARSSLA